MTRARTNPDWTGGGGERPARLLTVPDWTGSTWLRATPRLPDWTGMIGEGTRGLERPILDWSGGPVETGAVAAPAVRELELAPAA